MESAGEGGAVSAVYFSLSLSLSLSVCVCVCVCVYAYSSAANHAQVTKLDTEYLVTYSRQ